MDFEPKKMDEKGRDYALQRLACETGGEYIFIQDPAEFTANGDLPVFVRNRIAGSWRLTTETNLAEDFSPSQGAGFLDGGYLVSGYLKTSLIDGTEPTTGRMTADGEATEGYSTDRRLWLPSSP